jgi:putative phage-type endonuclease
LADCRYIAFTVDAANNIQKRTTFLNTRATGVGSSDIHHLFSEAPYGCRRLLWYQKSGKPADHPFNGNDATERGTILEPIAAQKYVEMTGRTLREVPVQRDPDFDYLLCHADRIIDFPHPDFGTDGVAEIKCPARETYFKMKHDGLPAAYNLQLQWAMLLHNKPWGEFIVFCADSWQLLNFEVTRDDELCKLIRTEAIKFWGEKENGPAPEKLDPKDPRCGRCAYRTTCQGEALLEMLEEGEEREALPFDVSLAGVVEEYRELCDIERDAKAAKEATSKAIKDKLGDRKAVETNGARLYFRPQTRDTVKSKDLMRHLAKHADWARELLDDYDNANGNEVREFINAQANLVQFVNEKFVNKSVSRPLRVIPQ